MHRPSYGDWSLPKGKREPGEHMLLTAVREVREETSLRVVLGPRLPSVRYEPGDGRSGWTTGRLRGDAAAASHEVDKLAWVPVAQARPAQLPGRHAGGRFAAPRPTVPLILRQARFGGP